MMIPFSYRAQTTEKAESGQQGLMLRQSAIEDATISQAPLSIKNRDTTCDLEIYEMKKGQQGCFGARAYIEADLESSLVHRRPRHLRDVSPQSASYEALESDPMD